MIEACTVCGGRLDDGRPVQHDLAGVGTHADCLDTVLHSDEGDDE